nr:zinc finger, CCHC-type [Tanacetum cinerariifolium]
MALNNAQTKTNSSAFRSMLEKHQLTGPNFNKWFHVLKLVVRTEKLQDVFETALPPAPAAGADAQAFANWAVFFIGLKGAKKLKRGSLYLYVGNESAALILNMVPTKKVWGCEAHVKRHTPDKLHQRSVKYFLEKDFILQKESGKIVELEDEDILPSENTSEHPIEEESLAPIVSQEEDAILVRRSVKTHKAPDRLCLNVEIDPDRLCFNVEVEEHNLRDLNEPDNYKAALSDLEFKKWLVAMNAEMQSMYDNKVWRLVVLPPNAKVVKSKWIYKKKTDMDGKVHIYKARLVAKGYTQTYRVDYKETFSPVVDIRAIRILIAIAAYYDYEIWQMDVKIAFLNDFLEEKIYMGQPEEMKRMHNVSYASVVGSIMYDVRCIRPDVAFTQNITSRFQQNSGEAHWTAVKIFLKYLRNNKDTFFVYGGDPKAELRVNCYCDTGFETNRDDTESQTSATTHGVWKHLADIFHHNKDAHVIQLDNEIRNMVIGNLSMNDCFQEIKSKVDRLVNLDSKVNDSSLVTYAINGVHSKFPDIARIIRHKEKLLTFDVVRSMILLEEIYMLSQQSATHVSHNTSSSPTILLAIPAPSDTANTMSTSGLDSCHNFQRGSFMYGARCKFVHGINDLDMIIDDSATAHGVWKHLADIFHHNKDARVIQLYNEIRNMVIGNLSTNDCFQEIKSKVDRLANLDSKVNDSSLVTYAINGVRSKFPDKARIIRDKEKLLTFDKVRSMILFEEINMLSQRSATHVSHNTSSSLTILFATPAPSDTANTMSTSGLESCHNFQRGSCMYGARCKFVYGINDRQPRPTSTAPNLSGKLNVNPRHSQNTNNTS